MIFTIYFGISAVFAVSLQEPKSHPNNDVMRMSEEFNPPELTHAPPSVGFSTPREISRKPNVPSEHDNVVPLTTQGNYIFTNPLIVNKLLPKDYNWQTITTTTASYNLYDTATFLHDTVKELNSFTFDIEAPTETMKTFCPRTKSCHSGMIAETYENIGRDCCLPCDCSDKCFDAGNCCPDKTIGFQQHQINGSVPDIRETCVQTFIAGSDYGNNYMNSSFLLFQICVDIGDEQTTMKCLQSNVSRMSEMTPVFSHNTGRHYRNIYCARCNADSFNVTKWQARLQCNTTTDATLKVPEFKTSSDFSPSSMIALNPNCVMLWDPPINETKVSRCLTNSDIVSECNKPGLDSLCQKYYFPVKGGNKIFRNIFCMECLAPSNFTGEYGFCYDVLFGFTITDFISLVSLKTYPKEISLPFTAENECSSDRTYSKELDTCILHTCPVTEVNAIGDCITLFSELSGVHIDYRLKFLCPNDVRLLSELHLRYVEFTLNVIGTNDDICWSDISESKTVNDFVEVQVQIVIRVTSRTNIKELYFKLENNVKAFNEIAKNDPSAFQLQIDTTEFDPMPYDYASFAKFTDLGSTICRNKIAMSSMQFCDTITFLKNEFEIYENGNVTVGDVMFVPGEFILRHGTYGTTKSVQICLDHYVSRHAEVTNRKYMFSSAVGVFGKSNSGLVFLLSALASWANGASKQLLQK